MVRRLRRSGNYALGIDVNCSFIDRTWWHKAGMTTLTLYSTGDLHAQAMRLMQSRPTKKITHLGVTCYGLKPLSELPLTLFETEVEKNMRIVDALDACNDKFGEYSVQPGITFNHLSTPILKVALDPCSPPD